MRLCSVVAPAKINLSLAITGRMENGYHSLETVFQSISLCDHIVVELVGEQIVCLCGELSGEDNLAYIAAKSFLNALKNEYAHRGKIPTGIKITIDKRIPVQAGLAGGSTDAAAVLKALNALYDYPFSWERLHEIAGQCGSDTAFCLRGGTQWGEGSGSALTVFPPVPEMEMILAKPKHGIDTKQAYRVFSQNGHFASLDKTVWYNTLTARNTELMGNMLSNSLEAAAFELVPDIRRIKNIMLGSGCKGALMSGSGSAVFGILNNKKHGIEIGELLIKNGFPDYWIVKTVGMDTNVLDMR